MDVTRDQAACLEAIDKPGDLAFVSSESGRELAGRNSLAFHAPKKHTRFLEGHAVFQAAAVQ
jgi:hypothetical protein